MESFNRFHIIAMILGVAVSLSLGVVIGYFSKGSGDSNYEEKEQWMKVFQENIRAENIEEYLKILSSEPHIAGKSRDEEFLANYIKEDWEEDGMEVVVHPYKVLLSYPIDDDPNYVAILSSTGTESFKSSTAEAIIDPSEDKPGVTSPFNAYSKSGDAEGDLVYVNYASVEDLTYANDTVGVTGKICIARYGKNSRSTKARIAEEYGCIALILYSDPVDWAKVGESAYPDTWYLPGTGTQRGNLGDGANGDALTKSYPAIKTAWRDDIENLNMRQIPVTPIGYDDAINYLSKMSGPTVPTGWEGGLNITYRMGPGFIDNSSKIFVHVRVNHTLRVTNNVIGYFKGDVEPDRYVILGNHRDAWVFGGIDPSSGTSVMLEIARVMGDAYKQGWRPRRTIMFCSWGAEEYGLVGSTEWVEEFQKVLSFRTVAYLNVDMAVNGNWSVRALSLPNLNRVMFEAAKGIVDPENDQRSVYDSWRERKPHATEDRPITTTPGGGSDYKPFVQIAGISIVDIRYTYGTTDNELVSYPVYHSAYETFNYVKNQVDRNFRYHASIGQMWIEIARQLSDKNVLPLNCVDYANRMIELKENFLNHFGQSMRDHDINTDLMDEAFETFKRTAIEFHQKLEQIDQNDWLIVRSANDQLMQLDRAFIDINGIENSENKHVVFSRSGDSPYSDEAFGGLTKTFLDIDDDTDQNSRWEEVRKQYSIILYHIGSATSTLRDIVPISGVSNLDPFE